MNKLVRQAARETYYSQEIIVAQSQLKKEMMQKERTYLSADIQTAIQTCLADHLVTAARLNYVTQSNNERVDSFKLIADLTRDIKGKLDGTSKGMKKRIYNQIKKLKMKFTLPRLNKLIKTISNILHITPPLILVSGKEQAIDTKRAKYKEAIAFAKKAKQEYLTEKADFYRNLSA